ASPSGVSKTKRDPLKEESTAIPRAVTLAPDSTPKLMTATSSRRSRIPITSGSSEFNTATPPGFTPSTISALARAMRSCEPKNSRGGGPAVPDNADWGGRESTRARAPPKPPHPNYNPGKRERGRLRPAADHSGEDERQPVAGFQIPRRLQDVSRLAQTVRDQI